MSESRTPKARNRSRNCRTKTAFVLSRLSPFAARKFRVLTRITKTSENLVSVTPLRRNARAFFHSQRARDRKNAVSGIAISNTRSKRERGFDFQRRFVSAVCLEIRFGRSGDASSLRPQSDDCERRRKILKQAEIERREKLIEQADARATILRSSLFWRPISSSFRAARAKPSSPVIPGFPIGDATR